MAEYQINPFTNLYERVDSIVPQRSSVTTDITLSLADEYVPVDATSGNRIITLPKSISKNKGKIFEVSKRDSSSNLVTVTADTDLPDLINGSATLIISFQYSAARICADGIGGWAII